MQRMEVYMIPFKYTQENVKTNPNPRLYSGNTFRFCPSMEYLQLALEELKIRIFLASVK